ncbi:hypothetical protein TNCV_3061541 [Trichonephila clavipes]|nr:hypothetical protein TNCV_3061541 [Trichonephila clavipes]
MISAEITRRMKMQYDDSCLLRSKISEWIDYFKKGKNSLCDDERSDSPSTSTRAVHRHQGYCDGKYGL